MNGPSRRNDTDAASAENGRLPVRARLARVGKYAFSIFAASFFPTFLLWLALRVPNAAGRTAVLV